MFFEKRIRKKKISPFYAEIIAGLIYNEVLWVFFVLFVLVITWPIGLWGTIFFLCLLVIAPLAVLIDMHPAAKRCWHLINDRRNHSKIISDLLILDYDFSFASYIFRFNIRPTFTHIVYMEPCLRIVFFKTVQVDKKLVSSLPLKFYLPELHFIYRLHEKCEELCEEYNQMVDDIEKGVLKLNFGERNAPEGTQVSNIYFYLTYDKVHAFNRLFELVNPHEFRITSYESSGVFISIEPIPGKEYPPEAIECMEKINAMYP